MSVTQRLGPYVLLERLGRGAMGDVWRARDDGTGTLAALKVLRPTDDERAERFAREAIAAARVRHPNVVSVLGSGKDGELSWIAYELAPGGDLGGLLERRGALPWAWAVGVAKDVARGLGAIHAAGLVHRDIKPQNILLDERGDARITDFGLAYGVVAASDLTRTGDVIGTPAYVSPEQADGRRDLTGAADCYALGLVLFEILSGKRPFEAEGLALLKAHMFEKAPRVSVRVKDVPDGLDRLVAALLEKDPRSRPDAAAVIRALEALGADPRVPARSLGVAAALGLVVVCGLVVRGLGPSRAAPPPVVAAPPPRPAPPAVELPGEPPESDDEKHLLAELKLGGPTTLEGMDGLNVAIHWNPTWFHARALRAEARIGRGELKEALAEVDELVKLFPRFARLHFIVAKARWHANERKAAVAAIESAARLAPNTPEILAYRGTYTFTERQESGAGVPPPLLAQAIADCTSALVAVQGEPRVFALTTRAYAREIQRDWSGAAKDWDELLALVTHGDRRVLALVQRGYCLCMLGDYAGAKVHCDQALEIAPRYADGYAVRGLARENDDPAGAIDDYQKSLDLAPGQTNAETYRARIAALRGGR